jgi:hypothetical protein
MIKNITLILAVTTLGCVSTAFSQSPISGFMQGKGKGSFSSSVQKNMIKCILFQRK